MPTGWGAPIGDGVSGWTDLRDDRGGRVGGVAVRHRGRNAYQDIKTTACSTSDDTEWSTSIINSHFITRKLVAVRDRWAFLPFGTG